MNSVTYKIKNDLGMFSHGIIQSRWRPEGTYYYVRFTGKGKDWTSEQNVKAHLLKCAQKGILEDTWEVVQVVHQPTKPLEEWVDQKMLMKIIKGGNK
jgi:hypothetical protein